MVAMRINLSLVIDKDMIGEVPCFMKSICSNNRKNKHIFQNGNL